MDQITNVGPSVRDSFIRGFIEGHNARIDRLCEEAKAMGPGWRVAISDPRTVRNAETVNWEIVTEHQFLEPGAGPAGAGTWHVFGPWA